MDKPDLILIETICFHYKIEISFIKDLEKIGLIKLVTFENNKFIHQDKISDLEKMIRLHHELNVNIEGIDVVFNLLQQQLKLKEEVNALKNKLQFYKNN